MKDIVYYVDLGLYGLIGLTFALIAYKVIALYLPKLVGRSRHTAVPKDSQDEYLDFLESGLALLAAIASSAPFIGLTGTVMHIMIALETLHTASIDITLISGPIAQALNSTLLGLASAIPALIAYNLMVRRVQVIENRFDRELKTPSNSGEPIDSPTTQESSK